MNHLTKNIPMMVVVSILLLAPVSGPLRTVEDTSTATIGNDKAISTNAVGFSEKSHHTWTIDNINLGMDMQLNATMEQDVQRELNMSEQELNTLIDKLLAIPNSLTTSNIDFFVGTKETPEEGEAYAFTLPSLTTGNDITVPKELFELAPNVDEDEAAELEFTLPKGSGTALISPIVPFISPTLETETAPTLSNIVAASFKQLSPLSHTAQLSPTLMFQSPYGIPYPYDMLTEGAFIAPVPFTNATKLSSVGNQLVNNMPADFNPEYTEDDGKGTFTASGEKQTPYGWFDIGNATFSLSNLNSQYALDSGILQQYTIEGGYTESDDAGNSVDLSLTFEMSHSNAETFSFGLENGDKHGYTFQNVTIDDGLIDALNGTVQGNIEAQGISEGVLEGIIEDTKMSFLCTGEAFNGLGLTYNATITSMENSTEGRLIGHPFGLSAPYVLPNWDLQFSYWQTHAHLLNKVGPNFLNSDVVLYDILGVDERANINVNNDYSILSIQQDGSITWASLENQIDATLGFNETIEGKISRSTAEITGDTWITYSGDGLLTEIGISLTIGLKYDEDDDGTWDHDDSYDIELTLHRVEQTTAGEPDYSTPIDAPDATNKDAGWEDVTPSREAEEGEGGGILGDTSTLMYIGAGVAGVLVVSLIVLALKKRGSGKGVSVK